MLYFTTWGRSRGCCRHRHRRIESAAACLREDQRLCRSHGGRSDRAIRLVSRPEAIEHLAALPPAGAPEGPGSWRAHVPLAR